VIFTLFLEVLIPCGTEAISVVPLLRRNDIAQDVHLKKAASLKIYRLGLTVMFLQLYPLLTN